MVDQIFIGNGVGYLGTAATNVILPIMTVTMAVGQMIGDGCATFMSLNMGKGNTEKAADGRANVSMIGMFIGCIVNLILDPIFIYVFDWGVSGAAWATFIGQL